MLSLAAYLNVNMTGNRNENINDACLGCFLPLTDPLLFLHPFSLYDFGQRIELHKHEHEYGQT